MTDDSLRWYYESKGGHAGPVTAQAIRDSLLRGSLSLDTLVWNETFGQSCKPIRDTNIADRTMRPPPLPKNTKRRRRWIADATYIVLAIALLWPLGIGGFVWVSNLLGFDTKSLLSDAIPKCDSSTAKTMAKQAIQGAPLAKVINIAVYEIQDAEEVAYDAGIKKRSCKAMAFLNSGKHEIKYTLEWASEREGKVWLQIQELPF